MKIETKAVKKFPKWLKVVSIAGVGVLVAGIGLGISGVFKDKGNFYDSFDKFTSQETCNFRYVFNIRTDDIKDITTLDLEDYLSSGSEFSNDTSAGDTESSANDYEDTTEETTQNRSQTGMLYGDRIQASWGTKDGSQVVDWDYPNFEVIITGRTESVEPFKSAMNIKINTEFINEDFCNIIFIEDKAYIDIQTLRNWLLGAGDSNLVNLAYQLPDNVVYLCIDDISSYEFRTSYAEDNERDSGAKGVLNLSRRLGVLEQLVSYGIKSGMGETGLSVDENKCRLSLTGNNSIKLIDTLKQMVLKSGSYYDSYTKALSSRELASEVEVTQLNNEKDNFLDSMSDIWVKFSCLDDIAKESMNLNVLGKTNFYNTTNGHSVMEVNLGASYNLDNKNYIMTLYGCKQDLGIDSIVSVGVPAETATSLSSVSGYDFKGVFDYLLYYFKINSPKADNRLIQSLSTIERGILDDFIVLVNGTNADMNGGLMKQDIYSINDYISHYASLSEEEANANEVTKVNYDLVNDLKEMLSNITDISDVSSGSDGNNFKWKGFSTEVGNMSYEGTVNTDETTSNLVVVDIDVRNIGADTKLNLSKWYILDDDGNKYPCNYITSLRGMDANFDISGVQEVATVPKTVISSDIYTEVTKALQEEAKKSNPDITDDELSKLVKTEGNLRMSDLTVSQIRQFSPTRVKIYAVIDRDTELKLYTDKNEEIGTIKSK